MAHFSRGIADTAPGSIFGIIAKADPDALLALAGYFEHQARYLRQEAKALNLRLRDSASARDRYHTAKNRFLRLGGRISVLARRYGGHPEAAISQMGNRTGLSRDQLAYALALWTKEKQRRARLKRDLVIYAEDLRGDRQIAIAARHGITARRVREIVADVKARIHRAR